MNYPKHISSERIYRPSAVHIEALEKGNALSFINGGSTALEFPIALKGGQVAALRDTGYGLTISQAWMSGQVPADPVGSSPLAGQRSTEFVHLTRTLLVRLEVANRCGEVVRILCTGTDIGYRGIRLSLPYTVGIRKGAKLDVDLFLPPTEEPVSVQGKVRRVTCIHGADIVRYAVEIEFCQIDPQARKAVSTFVCKVMLRKEQHLSV